MSMSALQSLESLDLNYASNAIQSPALAPQEPTWGGTSMSIAGVPLLVGDGEIEEIIETPAITPIPGTKPWALGVASHMGGLLPIISGDAFFRRRPYTGRVRDYCMVINRPGFYFGITLSSIEQDMKFPIVARDMEQVVDADFLKYSRGGFQFGEKLLTVLDIDKLVADSDISNASASDLDSSEEDNNE
jgi:twitching motility protein PilI